jgi:hypothetical protein
VCAIRCQEETLCLPASRQPHSCPRQTTMGRLATCKCAYMPPNKQVVNAHKDVVLSVVEKVLDAIS